MNGQWIGIYSGTNKGLIVADLDDIGICYAGFVFLYDEDMRYPATFAYVEIPKNQSEFSTRISFGHAVRGTGNVVAQSDLAKMFPEIRMPTYADTKLSIAEREISLTWKTDIQTNGSATISKSPKRGAICS
jgi:hypothetical protein